MAMAAPRDAHGAGRAKVMTALRFEHGAAAAITEGRGFRTPGTQ